jgi:hypothetical protein
MESAAAFRFLRQLNRPNAKVLKRNIVGATVLRKIHGDNNLIGNYVFPGRDGKALCPQGRLSPELC